MLKRRIQQVLENDLHKKMVFLSGPRQCGKTTVAKMLQKDSETTSTYYNWDIKKDKDLILQNKLKTESALWIFDEIHKFSKWKNWLKGTFDEFNDKHKILVTGSARLDTFIKGGDSLQGRYFLHHLHPITYSEFCKLKWTSFAEGIAPTKVSAGQLENLENLLNLGGFPEPLFSGSQKEAARWRNAYFSRVINEEIKSIESLKHFDLLELLISQLPERVGSILSINSLREGLNVAHETVQNWIRILEKMYLVFCIPPFGSSKIKAVKKEKKLYFWDWSFVEDKSKKFENLIAMHLLRYVHWMNDVEGKKLELSYFKNTVGHEIDFILLDNKKPWMAIEAKLSSTDMDSSFKYFLERNSVPLAFQVHYNGDDDWETKKFGSTHVRCLPAHKFLKALP